MPRGFERFSSFKGPLSVAPCQTRPILNPNYTAWVAERATGRYTLGRHTVEDGQDSRGERDGRYDRPALRQDAPGRRRMSRVRAPLLAHTHTPQYECELSPLLQQHWCVKAQQTPVLSGCRWTTRVERANGVAASASSPNARRCAHRRWIKLYASDQAAFFRDFEKAYIKLANLNTILA